MLREVSSSLAPLTSPAGRPDSFQPSAAAPAEPRDSAEITGRKAGFDLGKALQATAREAKSLAAKLPEHVEGEVLVKLKPGFTIRGMEDFASDYGAAVLHKFDIPKEIYQAFGGDLLQLSLPAGMTTAEAIAAMGKDPRVAYAASNDIVHSLGASADPVVPNDLDARLWGLNNTGQNGGKADADIDAPEAWAITTGSRTGPVVAVIDTGVDYNHQDLRNNAWTNPGEIPGNGQDDDGNGVVDDVHGYNAIRNSGDPMDDNAHGTHVSGTIAGEGNNGQGIVGVNWEGRVMGVKFLSGSGSGTIADAVKATLYATRMGARITSNSWGGGGFNQALYDALKASPALHIFAAGNESNDNDASPAYPASMDLDNIVSVAASDRNDRLAGFSNWGATTVDLAAPGVDILSSTPGNGYQSFSGTSMATPHVSGVAALIATKYPEASNEQIKARLMNGVDKIPEFEGKMISGGRLNAYNSLEDDSVAPGRPEDFGLDPTECHPARPTSVKLSWTAPGDDGEEGRASVYQIRYSDKPIVPGEPGEGEISFDQAQALPAGAPSEAGTTERATVRLTPSGQERTLYFALRTLDNVGNASEIAVAQVTVPPAQVAFEDNMDGEGTNWTADEGWGQLDVEGRGKVWTDSPEGEYGNDKDVSLTSRQISLAGLTGSMLVYEAAYDLESNYDYLHVELSRDGGRNWTELEKLNGSSGWGQHSLDLSSHDGQDVKIRFRLTTDGSVTKDGVMIDNVVIAGQTPEPPPPSCPNPCDPKEDPDCDPCNPCPPPEDPPTADAPPACRV